ncbi:putative competence-damage inducible protein [Clostridium acetireducens DSM 10703]|jgi:nicotinamide-nucleotide amidase|uniref:Putative competence-damage inducible protein n=1 Tax=Clostridium acetireducens DSM 10703 TaxID=1121290 RepID=A0A1E8F0N2_9CLOT|nr:competence/damage-inducible protein A [Clostridium acetireducens]OFI06975.1 putative competence-damage inducible protein [Clostridium acetireducens DSM 10703]
MKAEILAVGTEILLGDIVNTNAQYISKRLADIGIYVYNQSVVGDNPNRLKKSYETAFERCNLVITTGGLGPTKDDITKEIAFDYFNKKSILNEKALKNIETYFKKTNKKMAESNKKQAFFPKDSLIIPNFNGTAPGCIIEEKNKILIMLPGPPKEMIPMFEESVIPFLKKFQDGILISKVLRLSGIGESSAAELIDDILSNQTNPTIAPYAKEGEVIFRITAKAKSEKEAEKLIEPMKKELIKRFGNNIYGEGETNLQTEVCKLLIEKNLTIATAESCTGGLLTSKLIEFPGVSKCLLEGIVTYSNTSKIKRLEVKKETLDKFGAVSAETACEMAKGIAKTSNSDIGISTTGIAGPDGHTKENPVGLVFLGLYINGTLKTKKLNLTGDRNKIRRRATIMALNWLRKEIMYI